MNETELSELLWNEGKRKGRENECIPEVRKQANKKGTYYHKRDVRVFREEK